ncbi:hypothetical protein P9112_006091 [Eukaryota sp. TZLM1-RC]
MSSKGPLSQNAIRSLLIKRKYIVVIAFIFLQLSLGINYSFPTLIPHLVNDYGWRAAVSQRVWSCVVLVVGIFPILAGIAVRRYSYRFLTTTSGLVMFAGYSVASLNDGSDVLFVTLGAGVMAAAAIGFSYIVALRVSMSYFPKNKGLITGISVGVFGTGSLVWSAIVEELLKTNPPSVVFRVFSLSAPIAILLAGIFMVPNSEKKDDVTEEKTKTNTKETELNSVGDDNSDVISSTVDPTVEYEAERKGSVTSTVSVTELSELAVDVPVTVEDEILVEETDKCQKKEEIKEELMSIKQFFASKTFWLAFTIMIFGTSIGFMFLGSLRLYPVKALSNNNYDDDEIQFFTFLATSVAFNAGNGIGRIALGKVVDVIGSSNTLSLVLIIQSVLILGFIWLAAHPVTFIGSAFIISGLYGSMYVTMPVCLVDIWGQENFATVFPWIFLSSGLAGVVGPNIYAVFNDLGLSDVAFMVMSGLLLFSFLLSLKVGKTCKQMKQ